LSHTTPRETECEKCLRGFTENDSARLGELLKCSFGSEGTISKAANLCSPSQIAGEIVVIGNSRYPQAVNEVSLNSKTTVSREKFVSLEGALSDYHVFLDSLTFEKINLLNIKSFKSDFTETLPSQFSALPFRLMKALKALSGDFTHNFKAADNIWDGKKFVEVEVSIYENWLHDVSISLQ